MISFFTFCHNAIDGGYPIRQVIHAVKDYVHEIVVANCKSTDGTKDLLMEIRKEVIEQTECTGILSHKPEMRIIEGPWGKKAGETLAECHALHNQCKYNTIIHAEADEVFSQNLLMVIVKFVRNGDYNIAVHRIQTEQNFQRVREYPVPVHRVFPKGTVEKHGRTTNRHDEALILPPECGLLWDVQAPRDCWLKRTNQNAKLWKDNPAFRRTPEHFMLSPEINHKELGIFLKEHHWTWHTTPLNIPKILKPLLGKTVYE